jgi:hypothetical protein
MQFFVALIFFLVFYVVPNGILVTMTAHSANKKPLVQNSPPQSCSFTEGTLLNIYRAVMLLIILTILVGLYSGTDWIKKCP